MTDALIWPAHGRLAWMLIYYLRSSLVTLTSWVVLYLTTHLEAVPETLLIQTDREKHVLRRSRMAETQLQIEDDWKAEKDRLQTQMGSDTDSEPVPCHLIDAGMRETETASGVTRRNTGKERGLGSFWSEYTGPVIKDKPREKGEAERQTSLMPFTFHSVTAELSWTFSLSDVLFKLVIEETAEVLFESPCSTFIS